MFVLAAALKAGYSIKTLYELTKVDEWFLHKMKNIIDLQLDLEVLGKDKLLPDRETMLKAKQLGFSDNQIAHCVGTTSQAVRKLRKSLGEPHESMKSKKKSDMAG